MVSDPGKYASITERSVSLINFSKLFVYFNIVLFYHMWIDINIH